MAEAWLEAGGLTPYMPPMRAEIETLAESIKQSIELLRRRL
jgi:hypothetical protein